MVRVVIHSGLNEMLWHVEVLSRRSGAAAAGQECLDDLPDIGSRDQSGSPAGWAPIHEEDSAMPLHPDGLLQVPLGQRADGRPTLACLKGQGLLRGWLDPE